MVNRSMEAKRIKYLKQSRARPRSLRMNNGQQKVKQSVDKSKIPEEYLALFNYRERAKIYYPDQQSNQPFRLSQAHAEANWQAVNIRHQTKPAEYMYVKLVDGKRRIVTLFHNSELTVFFVVEEQISINLVRWSVTYNNRDRIIDAFNTNSVKWKYE